MENLEEAVVKFLQGDTTAFQRIVTGTSARLVRLGARIMGSQADAEDVVQETYLKAHRALLAGKFDRRARIETWLYRILVNEAIDAKRKKKHQPITADRGLETGWDGQGLAEARVALAELNDWLTCLSEEQRVALVLSAFEGLSSAEIATITNSSEGAVEQRLVRARALLRQKRQES